LIAGGSTVTGGGSTVTGGGSTAGGETVTVPGGTTVCCVSVGLMTTVGDVVVVVVVVVVVAVSPASSPSPQPTSRAPVLAAAAAKIAGGHAFRFVIASPSRTDSLIPTCCAYCPLDAFQTGR
jgi:hypothetical protein